MLTAKSREVKSSFKKKARGLLKDIQGIQSGIEKIRSKSFSVLYPLSGILPSKLYPYWDVFEDMLRRPEVSNKYCAIHILANLTQADRQNKFGKIFDYWFHDLLNHESPVVSAHTAEKSGKIVNAKPKLEPKITKYLLNAENTSSCRHPELLKAYILSAFDIYFDKISDKNSVIEYIIKQTANPSPTTRNKAKNIIKKLNLE